MPQIQQLLRREIEKAGGLSQWARRKGISRVHLSRVLHGRRPLGMCIIHALGFEEAASLDLGEVLRLLRQEIKEVGSQSEWARRTGVNRSSLNLALSGRRAPGADILRALKIQMTFARRSGV
jgi:DNA-binding phage protein